MSLLSVKNLSVHFSSCVAVENLSFEIQPGETLGILGKSGSGKTSAARALLRLLPSASISGSVFYKNENLLSLKEKTLRTIRGKEIGFIFQHPSSALNPSLTIKTLLFEALDKKFTKTSLELRAKDLLLKVGLKNVDSILSAYPHALSGGQKQKVLIAIALASNPKLLIADEPTASLDEEGEETILTLFETLRVQEGLSFLIISHQMKILSRFCHRLLLLDEGKTLQVGPTEKILSRYHSINFPKITKISSPPPPSPLLKIENLFVAPILHSISFSLYPRQTLGLIGKNGSGKSTLAKAILKLIPHTSGRILFEDSPLPLNPPPSIRRRMQMIFQDPGSSLNPRMSVEQILLEPLQIHNITSTPKYLLDLVDLPAHLLSHYPHELSGGQKQRLCIARALALKPSLLICDEPFSALDPFAQGEILKLFKTLQKELGLACLLISHDLELIEDVATEVIGLQDGKVINIGDFAPNVDQRTGVLWNPALFKLK